jgi:hypothetical protein
MDLGSGGILGAIRDEAVRDFPRRDPQEEEEHRAHPDKEEQSKQQRIHTEHPGKSAGLRVFVITRLRALEEWNHRMSEHPRLPFESPRFVLAQPHQG